MKKDREIRRLAFQALFQLDVRGEAEFETIKNAAMDELGGGLDVPDRESALELARAAYADRRSADEAVSKLAPTWPAHRQPAVDRAILRLAHHEMTSGRTAPKIAVNEAIELAKEFSTERSPAFINGVLDKVLKRVLAEGSRGGKPAAPAPEPAMDPDLAAELGLDVGGADGPGGAGGR